VLEEGVVTQGEEGTPQGATITPWTQKITSSSSVGFGCGVRYRCLICAVNGNMLAARVTILRRRKGAAPEQRIRTAERGPQPGRGRRCVVPALCPVAPASVSLSAGSAPPEGAGRGGGAHHPHHDQGAGAGSREAARVFGCQRHDHGRDRCASGVEVSRPNAAPWLRGEGAAMRFEPSSCLIVWGPASWSKPTGCWYRNVRAR